MPLNDLPCFEGIEAILNEPNISLDLKIDCMDIYIKSREEFVRKYGSSLHQKDYVAHEMKKRDYSLIQVGLYLRGRE